MVDLFRNDWTRSFGTGGRFNPESVVGISGIPMEEDKAFYPTEISLFGTDTVMFEADLVAHAIKQARGLP